MGEEADGESSKDTQDPDPVAVTDSASVLVGACIQSLMQSIFDAPIRSDRFKALSGVEFFMGQTGDQENGFGFSG